MSVNTSDDLFKAVQSDLEPGKNAPEATEDMAAREQFMLFKRAWDNGHATWVRNALKYDRFYVGDQWEASTKQALDAAGRPYLTINLILSTLNVVFGEQIGTRTDITYKNRSGASPETADALSKYVHAILDRQNYRWTASTVFADGLIQDRGYFDVRIDWSENLDGEIKVTELDPTDVIPDPDAKSADVNTWKEVFVTRWVSLDDVAVQYGQDIADKIQSLVNNGGTYGNESIKFTTEEQTFGNTFNARTDDGTASATTRRAVRCIRVIERQFKQSVRIFYLVDPATGKRRALPVGTTKTEAKSIAERYKVLMQPVTEQRVRWRVTADRFVLHDEWSPYRTFTVIPYFPYFRRGKPFGMVANLISPQEQYNKLSSQELHIVNSTANGGWIVEEGALVGMTSDELAQQGSKSGIVITTAPNRLAAVKKIEPNTVPVGITNVSTKAANNVFTISGVNQAMLGTESPEVSGVALEKKTSVGQVQLAVVLDNFEKTQHMLARKMLELIKDYVTYETAVTFVNTGAVDPINREQTVVLNQPQEDGTVKNDVTVGEFDIVVSSSPDRDTYNEIQFAKLLNLRNVGVPVPGYRIIQVSDVENRDEIAQEMRSIEGLAEVPPEVQQQQQRAAELELSEKEAKIEKDRALADQAASAAEVNAAKAEEIRQAPEQKQRERELTFVMDQEGLRVRERLETIKAQNKLDTKVLDNLTKPPPSRPEA